MHDSENLIGQYKLLHADTITHFPGYSILPHAYLVHRLIRKFHPKSLLDYGCGSGLQYHKERLQDWFGVMPYLYDPAVPLFETPPAPDAKFDGIICSDVMEHIAERDIPSTLQYLTTAAQMFIFFTICCRPARRLLPDGRNAHVTVRPESWWHKQVSENDASRCEGRSPLTIQLVFTP